ncbi:DUF742 domain-containing protein [Amycolatopsis panacis]|uniref:DUF742 domain-containing protein n=1 Tax=Amycolatopsis panacis TaxID=2340917 RepID=A0A419HT33_9PSEU|nr:DUF742 domain-containing protein [Amycolatopsis panacis]RJQ79834.1 DUF742 domain-containing protein [Amycolatopsis panacis]
MRISGFGEQDTGAWEALHRGDDRTEFDSPSRFELSTLKMRLPARPNPVRPAPPRAVPPPPPPPPAPLPPPPVQREDPVRYDDGYREPPAYGGDGRAVAPGYWPEEPPRGQHAAPEPSPSGRRHRVEEPPDPYSFDEYADRGSPGAHDRMVPEEPAYRYPEEAPRSRHAQPPPPQEQSGASALDQFWSAEGEGADEAAPADRSAAKPKSRVRPYARTRGRTHSDYNLALEALVSTSDSGRRYRGVRSIEHRRICDLCLDTRSVAEIAAHLHLPLGVVKVLVGDMADIGLVLLHQTDLVLGDRSSREFMERVLQGLRSL